MPWREVAVLEENEPGGLDEELFSFLRAEGRECARRGTDFLGAQGGCDRARDPCPLLLYQMLH